MTSQTVQTPAVINFTGRPHINIDGAAVVTLQSDWQNLMVLEDSHVQEIPIFGLDDVITYRVSEAINLLWSHFMVWSEAQARAIAELHEARAHLLAWNRRNTSLGKVAIDGHPLIVRALAHELKRFHIEPLLALADGRAYPL